MAKWNREKVDSSDLNNGNEWEQGDRVARQELNAIINAGLYAQDFAEHLADTPDTSEANNVGIPTVDFVDNPNATTGKPYKRFKFSNLKGNKGDKGDKGDVGTQWYNSSYYEAGFRPSVGYVAVIAKSTIDGNPVLNDYIFFVNWYGTIGRVALVSDTTVTITVQTSIEAYVNADDALSTTSINPVQNKVVTENINNIKVLTGTGVPSVLDGVVGQLYLDTASKRLYQCVSQEYDDSGNVHRKWEELITKKYLEYDWEYVTTYILNQTSDAHWAIVPNFDFENYDYYFESTLILENGGFNGLMFTDANSNVLTFNVRWNRIATEGGSGSGSSTTWAGYQAVREDNLIYGVDTMSGSNRFIRETIKLSRQANTTGSDDSGPNIDYEFNSWASYAGSQRNYMVRGYVYPTDTTSTLSIKGISRFVGEGTAGYLPNSFMRMYRRKRRNETGG